MGVVVAVANIKGPEDSYADLVEDVDEETLANMFSRLCNKRHLTRSDIKKHVRALLKINEWKELLAAVFDVQTETSMNNCKFQLF